MKSFYQYLAESIKEFNFRLKTIEPLDDEAIFRIKTCLSKYDLVEMGDVEKTMAQYRPLDFPNVEYGVVSILDFKVRVPVSSYVLLQDLKSSLQLPESSLVVRGENEPMELEAQKAAEELRREEEKEKKSLLSDSAYSEYKDSGERPYGNEHNKNFLSYIASLSATKSPKTFDETQATEALFGQIKSDNKVADDFNKEFDTPKPVHKNTVKNKKPKEPTKTEYSGNYSTSSLRRKG